MLLHKLIFIVNLERMEPSLTLPSKVVHLIQSGGMALITKTHGGALPEKRHLLPVHCDSLALAMCCLFYVCERERMRDWNREQGKEKQAEIERGTYANTKKE